MRHEIKGNSWGLKSLAVPASVLFFAFFASPSYAATVKEDAAAGGAFSYYVVGDKKAAMAQLYPEGSVGGQCGHFGAKVMGKPFFKGGTGGLDSFRFKLTLVDPLAGSEGHPIAVGDAIVQDMKNAVGHFAVINGISKDAKGRVVYVLTESNWNLDGKVTHGRTIFADDPSIKGIVRGDGARSGDVVSRYDARLVFPAAKSSVEMNAAGFIRAAMQDISTSSPEAVASVRATTQKLLDDGEIAGAVNSLLPLVTDRSLSARLASSLKALGTKSAAKTTLAPATKSAALK